MKMLPPPSIIALLFALAALVFSGDTHAQAMPSQVMAQLLEGFRDSRGNWLAEITNFATWLFWTMALIGLVWQFGMMLFGTADIGAFIGNLVRFMVLVGVFLWLLTAGSDDDGLIMMFADSVATLGARMAGSPVPPPDNLIMPGLRGLQEVIGISGDLGENHFSMASNMALITVIALTLASVNIVLLTVALWILAYAGIFLLGFGGARWSSDIAVNYFKHVGSVVFSLLVLRLVSTVAAVKLEALYSSTAGSSFTLMNQAFVMVMAIGLAVLMTRLPGLLSSILLGAKVAQGNSAYFLSGQAAAVAGSAISAAGQSVSSSVHAVYNAYGRNQGWTSEDRGMFDTRVASQETHTASNASSAITAATQAFSTPASASQQSSGDVQRLFDTGVGAQHARGVGGGSSSSESSSERVSVTGVSTARAGATATDRQEEPRTSSRSPTDGIADMNEATNERQANLADPQAAEARFGTSLDAVDDVRPSFSQQDSDTAAVSQPLQHERAGQEGVEELASQREGKDASALDEHARRNGGALTSAIEPAKPLDGDASLAGPDESARKREHPDVAAPEQREQDRVQLGAQARATGTTVDASERMSTAEATAVQSRARIEEKAHIAVPSSPEGGTKPVGSKADDAGSAERRRGETREGVMVQEPAQGADRPVSQHAHAGAGKREVERFESVTPVQAAAEENKPAAQRPAHAQGERTPDAGAVQAERSTAATGGGTGTAQRGAAGHGAPSTAQGESTRQVRVSSQTDAGQQVEQKASHTAPAAGKTTGSTAAEGTQRDARGGPHSRQGVGGKSATGPMPSTAKDKDTASQAWQAVPAAGQASATDRSRSDTAAGVAAPAAAGSSQGPAAHAVAPAGSTAATPAMSDKRRGKRLIGELLSEDDSRRAREQDSKRRNAADARRRSASPDSKGKRKPDAVDAEDEIAQFRDGPDKGGEENDA